METLIITAGFEEYGITNSIWLVHNLKGFKPKRVYILTNDNKTVRKVVEKSKAIIKEKYDAEVVEVEFKDEDFKDYKEKLKGIFEKEQGNEVAIDVTHGRKYMCIFSFNLADKYKANHVFYAHLKNVENYKDKPIDEIPVTMFKLIDFLEEVKK